jgi:HEPN domain-containing protein
MLSAGVSALAKRVREDAEWWLAASIDDYESAQLLFKGGKYSKCIHVLHNSVEKALKAVILSDKKRPPRGTGGHNLVRLHSMVSRRVKLSPKLVRTLDDLSPLYLPSEYPDAALGIPGTLFKKEQAQRYLREVGEVIRWLGKRMSRE